MTADRAPVVRITVDGRLALTVEQAAARHGMAPNSMSSLISREGIEYVAKLDGKKRLYAAAALDAIVRARPGRGAHLRKGARS